MSADAVKPPQLKDDPLLLRPQVDNRQHAEPLKDTTQAVQLCDRHFGVGADGVRKPTHSEAQCATELPATVSVAFSCRCMPWAAIDFNLGACKQALYSQ